MVNTVERGALTPTGLSAAKAYAEEFIEFHEFPDLSSANLVCLALLQVMNSQGVQPATGDAGLREALEDIECFVKDRISAQDFQKQGGEWVTTRIQQALNNQK